MSKILLWTGGVLGCLAAAAVFYFLTWAIAYPDLGYHCTYYVTVKGSELTGHSDWDGDHYLTTYSDGTQATTGYVRIGERVCAEHETRFPF